ncbi:MAG: hypothetical protein ABIS39_08665 [Sphingomicrobium sp.]
MLNRFAAPLILATIALSATSAMAARAPVAGGPPPAAVQSLLACRALTDSAARLACYDKAAAGVAQAIDAKELVLIDKAKAIEVKRSLFGYSAPDFAGLLGGGDVKQVEGVVRTAFQNGEGGWTVKLQDGSVWIQNDDAPIALSPRGGDKVTIRRGTLNSYFLRIGSQPGVKVHRIN